MPIKLDHSSCSSNVENECKHSKKEKDENVYRKTRRMTETVKSQLDEVQLMCLVCVCG